MKKQVIALKWEDDTLLAIDQRILPAKESWVKITNIEECFEAIQTMVVRGAPLIGFTAIYGMALLFKDVSEITLEKIKLKADYLKSARPTAVNLEFEITNCMDLIFKHFEKNNSFNGCFDLLVKFAEQKISQIHDDNMTMAKLAYADLKNKYGDKKLNLMTLCNTGALACGPMGTALGVITYIASLGKIDMVYASETRPYLQGGRLTSYELIKSDIEHRIVVEGAASYILGKGLVDAIFIGADRIVSNGDSANKVGSSSLAIIAKHYGIPFYVVAPCSSFDLEAKVGEEIEIELRDENEILSCGSFRIAPEGARALNPSFDVTKSELIEAIICENGLIKKSERGKLVEIVKG